MANSTTDRLGPGLLDLPSALLQRILKLALEDNGISRLSLLHGWSKFVATQVAPQILLESLTIQDDDQLLLDAEELARRTDESEAMRLQRPVVASTALAAVWLDSNKARSVRRLRIITPTPVDYTSSTTSPPLGVDFAPLEDTSFLLLLSKLQHLTRFTWSASRLPSLHLCQALGQACKELTHFTFELKTELDSSAIPQEGLSSPRVGSGASNIAGGAPPQLRAALGSWLPLFPSFPALDSLELARTIFVDDALLTEIAASAKKLRRFKIREMTGTKLSDAGLAEVLGECVELEELVLDCIEGRLSKSCWSKLAPLPSNLDTLSIYFYEPSPHKSWATDHLLSLPSAISDSTLTSLTVSRRCDPGALIPGKHHHSRFPVDQIMVPKELSKELLDALLERADEWRSLNLDMWKIGVEDLKKLMDSCSGLVKLKVLFDEPFRGLLTLASSFALSQNLRQFYLSIDPSHAPELNSIAFTSSTGQHSLPVTPGASPTTSLSPLPTKYPSSATELPASPPSTRRSSATSLGAGAQVLTTAGYAARSPIASREWRRFLKKTHRLEEINWYGRGGVGVWRFDRGSHGAGSSHGASKVDVEFEPIIVVLDHSNAVIGASEDSNIVGWRGGERRRRSSSVSLVGSCLSGLALSTPPTSPPVGAIGQERESGSPQAARNVVSSSPVFGLGLTGFSPFTPSSTSSYYSSSTPPSSTSPSTRRAPPEQPPRTLSASLAAGSTSPIQSRSAPQVYPGGWHSGKQRGGEASGGEANFGKEKRLHLEREREKERQREKEREVERRNTAGVDVASTATTAVSSRDSTRTSSPDTATSRQSPLGGGKVRGSSKPKSSSTREGTLGGAQTGVEGAGQSKGQATERVIPGLPASAVPKNGGARRGGRK